MSSTNQGKRNQRLVSNPLDFFETPAECVQDLVAYLPELRHTPLPPGCDDAMSRALVLDAGCGTGAIGVGLVEAFGARAPAVIGVELDEARACEAESRGLQVLRADFTTLDPADLEDVTHVVGNPPFNDAAEFIRAGLRAVGEGGLVAYLLRLNFLGSGSKRADVLVAGSGLYAVFVMTDRPSVCTSATCKACRGTWQFEAGRPLAEALHPHENGCLLVGARPTASGKYRASRTDSCDYAWIVWKKGHRGPAKLDVIPSRKPTHS